MSDLLKLRDYQSECLYELAIKARDGLKRPAIVLPTGTGKTVIFSHAAKLFLEGTIKHKLADADNGRVLILVDRDELVGQTVDKLSAVAPHLNVGVVKADRNEHEGRDVIVASIQTVRKLFRLDQITATGRIGLVIVDECDLAAAESYVTVLTALGCFNDQDSCMAVGLTATLARSDSKSLGDIWQEVIFQRDILDMIPKYLCDVTGKKITVDGLSLADVTMSRGDYAIGSLSEMLMSADAPEFGADAWEEHAKGRPGVCFLPSVETAHAFTRAFRDRGMEARAIWGSMPLDGTDGRRDVLARAHAGDLEILVNCMVLTRGFDWPAAEVGMIGRPTTSASLYVQMVGRLLRLNPLKKDKRALILDLVGATEEHRLATLADLSPRRRLALMEGESLIEAAEREREQANISFADFVRGHEDVDLFQRTTALWLQTHKGFWFIPTSEWLYFIDKGSEPGMYRLGKRKTRNVRGGGWINNGADMPLETAMSWGEQLALEADPMVAERQRAWRKTAPSPRQLTTATNMGIKFVPGIRKGQLSSLIEIENASRLMDRSIKTEKAYT
jgi:superfamily II DNA or RNA helicase